MARQDNQTTCTKIGKAALCRQFLTSGNDFIDPILQDLENLEESINRELTATPAHQNSMIFIKIPCYSIFIVSQPFLKCTKRNNFGRVTLYFSLPMLV